MKASTQHDLPNLMVRLKNMFQHADGASSLGKEECHQGSKSENIKTSLKKHSTKSSSMAFSSEKNSSTPMIRKWSRGDIESPIRYSRSSGISTSKKISTEVLNDSRGILASAPINDDKDDSIIFNAPSLTARKSLNLDQVPSRFVALAKQPKSNLDRENKIQTTGIGKKYRNKSNDSLNNRLQELLVNAETFSNRLLHGPSSAMWRQPEDNPNIQLKLPFLKKSSSTGDIRRRPTTKAKKSTERLAATATFFSLPKKQAATSSDPSLSTTELASRERKLSTHSVRETCAIDYSNKPVSQSIHLLSLESISSTSSDECTQAMINQYLLVKEIGEGSFSKVLLVYDTQLGRYYACKAVSKKRLRKKNIWRNGPQRKKKSIVGPEFPVVAPEQPAAVKFDYMQMIRREIAIMKRLSCHPRVSTLVEVLDDEKHDTLYMVFELCEYGSIMKLSPSCPAEPFSEELACRYFRDVVLGLEYLHYMQIIHCDIKPENILLNDKNHAIIGDFSISYSDGIDSEPQFLGNGLLTPVFTPPERITSSQDSLVEIAPLQFNAASDIWALGVTLFCFVHGHLPYDMDGKTMDEIYGNIVSGSLTDKIAPTISKPLRDLLAKLMEKDPMKRINLVEIKQHLWVLKQGPMMSTEDNCVLMSGTQAHLFPMMSDAELTSAIKPAIALVDKIRTKLKCKKRASLPSIYLSPSP